MQIRKSPFLAHAAPSQLGGLLVVARRVSKRGGVKGELNGKYRFLIEVTRLSLIFKLRLRANFTKSQGVLILRERKKTNTLVTGRG